MKAHYNNMKIDTRILKKQAIGSMPLVDLLFVKLNLMNIISDISYGMAERLLIRWYLKLFAITIVLVNYKPAIIIYTKMEILHNDSGVIQSKI